MQWRSTGTMANVIKERQQSSHTDTSSESMGVYIQKLESTMSALGELAVWAYRI